MHDRFLIMKDGERIMWTERFGSMMEGDTEQDLDGAVDKIKAMMEADKDRLN